MGKLHHKGHKEGKKDAFGLSPAKAQSRKVFRKLYFLNLAFLARLARDNFFTPRSQRLRGEESVSFVRFVVRTVNGTLTGT
jgi:hypothetical protein